MKTRVVKVLYPLTLLFMCAVSHAGEPLIIAEGVGQDAPKQPQAAIAADGTVHLVYGAGQAVYHCRSVDGGASFSVPVRALQTANMSLGMRRGPRVAVGKNNLVISAIGGAQGKGRDGDILAWRSADNGQSWQGPTRVNDVPDSAREGLHAMTASVDGTVWCVWLDLRSKRTELYAAHSTDGGATWSDNQLVYRSPDGSICECCHPSIATHGTAVHVLFRNSLAGNRDMYLVSSEDGRRFGEARQLGTEHWPLKACPMDGGMLTVKGDGTVATAWRRGGLVYATDMSSPDEALLGRGEQPWIASTLSESFAVWTASRDGELFVKSSSAAEPRSLARMARDPFIVTSPSGGGPVLVCWESKQGEAIAIHAATITPR